MNKYSALGPCQPDPETLPTRASEDPVLRALVVQEAPSTVPQLAERLDVHLNTVRTKLSALLEEGLAEREPAPASGRGRPSHVYRPTPAGRAALPGDRAFEEYRGLTGVFAEHLARHSTDPAGQAREIGHAWGVQLAGAEPYQQPSAPSAEEPDDQVLRLLDRLKFSPEPDDDGVALRTCPLLELATQLPEVVCRVHLGVVEGALERYGSADRRVELMPFAEPGACRLRLRPARGATDSPE